MKKILIIIFVLMFGLVIFAADLFEDNFESGDLSNWSASGTYSGDLSVTHAAALHDSYGASFFIDDGNELYMRDSTPDTETRYRFRFYLDPNSLTMADPSWFLIFKSIQEDWSVAPLKVYLLYSGSAYKINAKDATDGGDYSKYTSDYTITDAPHCIEIDWMASTGAGNDDGYFSLWIDGVLKETVSDIDSDTEDTGHIHLTTSEFSSVPSGTLYMDDFASNDDGSEIGRIISGTIFFGTNF